MGKNNQRQKTFFKSPFGRLKNLDLNLKIENATDKETNVYIYDEISWWGITAEKFVKDLNEIKTPIINLHINSPGGAVFDGTAIYNALKQHKSKIITYIDGLAASISSIVALSGSEVIMAENAFYMMHKPFSIVIGTAEDMRAEADLLDKVTVTINKIYQKKSGKKEQEISELMASETWFTAEEALKAGFIDKIYEDKKEETEAKATMFDLSVFAHVPDVLNKTEKPSKRDLESILRDAGCSTNDAKAIISRVQAGDSAKNPDNNLSADCRDGEGADNDNDEGEEDSENRRDAETEPVVDDVNQLLIKAKTISGLA